MNSKGLLSAEVAGRRAKYGANTMPSQGGGGWRIVAGVVTEPMVLLLLVACFLYFFMGQYQEGIIMAGAILLVAGISVYQQVRSENAVKALHKLTSPLATVIRDGRQVDIPSGELVVGDAICVTEGRHVSADAEITELYDLSVDESILTGESLPVENKVTGSMLYSGTSVTSGMAWGTITAVGPHTRIGKLGKSMEEIRKEKTPLQLQISSFVRMMALFGVIAFLVVWLYNYLESQDVVASLMQGLTLAMSVLPEEIPVALSTFMALGAYRMIRKNVLAKHPQTVEALGAATVICLDKTGTITENRMKLAGAYDFHSNRQFEGQDLTKPEISALLLTAVLASEENPFDPMEKALHEAYAVFKDPGNYRKTGEYPLGGDPPKMTHVYVDARGNRIIAVKGAPEGILAKTSLTETEKEHVRKILLGYAQQGFRVLAVGRGRYAGEELPSSQEEFQYDFSGLVALADPPKENIREVIQSFYEAGIDIKMITGDFPETAMSIARQAGIHSGERYVTGKEIADMNEQLLNKTVSDTTLFARVPPEMKLRIIDALKKNGEIVAMTGDGVNDGPALKSSHIGIAMGNRGSEVARKAASLVLTTDDLGAMVNAILIGRNIYANLKKAIQYIISIHIPLISVVTLPLLLGWKFPHLFSPVHVIFLELIMGPTCSIVYENEPVDTSLMKNKPRKMSDSLFTWGELSRSILQGIVITVGLMALMYYLISTGSDEGQTRTMLFTALVLSNILLTFTGRSTHKIILHTLGYRNVLLPIIIGITIVILALSLYFIPFRDVFQFTHIGFTQLLVCAAVAMASVLWIDLYKLAAHRNQLPSF